MRLELRTNAVYAGDSSHGQIRKVILVGMVNMIPFLVGPLSHDIKYPS